jgi:toxin-antitoxin system PIN domain toxin
VIGLLDVNVLIALVDSNHVHHEAAHGWFATGRGRWATCPITENGLVRIISNPKYANGVTSPAVALALLARLKLVGGHVFWPDDISLTETDAFRQDHLLASHQVTDIYLLGLAARRGGRLITFDRRLSVAAVPDGEAALLVL